MLILVLAVLAVTLPMGVVIGIFVGGKLARMERKLQEDKLAAQLMTTETLLAIEKLRQEAPSKDKPQRTWMRLVHGGKG